MILKHITVRNLGSMDFFTCDFAEGFNFVRSRYADEITYALQILLNHKGVSLHGIRARSDSKIEAVVFMEEKEYRLLAAYDSKQETIRLRAWDTQGDDVTKEYLHLTNHCREHDLAGVFQKESENDVCRVMRYMDEDRYFRPKELSKLTDGLSELKAFHGYLRSFVGDFQPEKLREEKGYEFVLRENGSYDVRSRQEEGSPVCLSESEKTLFHYLCFLYTAEFWHGFEELRNLHGIKKPLLIKDFLPRLDKSIDVTPLLRRTMKLSRQAIILS